MTRWEKGGRYYEAHVERDLWGEWVLTLVWGRRGSRRGRVVHRPVADAAALPGLLAGVAARRARRGYRVVAQGAAGAAAYG